MDHKNEKKTDKMFIIILAMIFLTPDIRVPGLSFFRLEQLFSVFLLAYLFIKNNLVGEKSLKIRAPFVVYLILGGSYLLSLFHTQLLLSLIHI